MTFRHVMYSHGQAGAQHSQSPITAEGGAVMMISDTGNTSGSRRKCVTSDTLAAPMAFWQCRYPSNIPRSAADVENPSRVKCHAPLFAAAGRQH
jgi:hypothetical protein